MEAVKNGNKCMENARAMKSIILDWAIPSFSPNTKGKHSHMRRFMHIESTK